MGGAEWWGLDAGRVWARVARPYGSGGYFLGRWGAIAFFRVFRAVRSWVRLLMVLVLRVRMRVR